MVIFRIRVIFTIGIRFRSYCRVRFRIMSRLLYQYSSVGFFAEVNSLTEVWFILLNQSLLIGHIKYRTSSRETQLNHFLREQTLVPLLNSTSGKQELKILSAFLNR